jgi:hypothetical protein
MGQSLDLYTYRRMRLIRRRSVVLALSAFLLASGTRAQSPPPPPKLDVVVQPVKARFSPSESLAFTITLRNASSAAFRLPERMEPPILYGWRLRAKNIATGELWTGAQVSRLGTDILRECVHLPTPPLSGGRGAGVGECIARPSAPIRPGEAMVLRDVSFHEFGFVKGDSDAVDARHTIGQQILDNQRSATVTLRDRDLSMMFLGDRRWDYPAEYRLPPGGYRASLFITFVRPVVEDQDVTPVWYVWYPGAPRVILESNEFNFTVGE